MSDFMELEDNPPQAFERYWLRRMSRFMMLAAVAITALALEPARSQEVLGPPLDPRRAHIMIHLDQVPDLRFHPTLELHGAPGIAVNDRGAFVGTTRVCKWSGGRFDLANRMTAVLGDPTSGTCPAGFPVISGVSDRGLGAPVLFIEVFARNGPMVEVRFRQRSYYFNLNTLPGDPADPVDISGAFFIDGPSMAALGFTRARTGQRGWAWELSEVESKALKSRAADALWRDPAFAAFIRNVQSCFNSERVPQCLVPFVADHVGAQDVDARKNEFTSAEFVAAIWREGQASDRHWNDVRDCFFSRDLDAGTTEARLVSPKDWSCFVSATKLGWKLDGFVQGG